MTYGINIVSDEDIFLRATIEGVGLTTKAVVPGSFLVNTPSIRTPHRIFDKFCLLIRMLTSVKQIPEWFPEARFKAFARVAREKLNVVVDEPLECVKESMRVRL